MVGNPIKFSRTAVEHNHAPPLLGEHTGEVLGSLLGLDEGAIGSLRKDGIV
jgi:crotonobetainyl-CoA:carnitine CoA-transferase CaiB-like acyl-CoA transferase